ncbi:MULTISPECIES: MFS transporter [Streptomyces]|uniref:MFS transporter n=3 Tax=Streptomyces TaxID=1883 RepID=A0A8H9HDH8_9ACTN|nr:MULTISPECIES: MFS transporter [Streptomyces]MDQ0295706.1 MFS family permease [Streptomyces sp. DSM 41037]WPR50994.1 MFS transporter [Streptomyces sp. S399]WSU37997.1 MFS transporter [Streptomyces gougerotii]SUP62727.1 Major facilitator family transporter [Streptomyces griseus]GFH65928.1 MFS transporter [Streptomyces rutgersensis]
MTVVVATPPTVADRRARVAVAVLFFTNGALFANLLPRYPQIKEALGITNAGYGLAVAAFPAGAVAAGLAAGVVIRRLGSARAAVAGTLLTAAGIVAAGFSGTVALFAAALFLAGAMDAITDVAQNAHGLRVQRRYGRSVINSFHAIWSIGAVTGGAMAAGAIALGVPPGRHLAVSGAVFTVVASAALRFCLPGPDTGPAVEPVADAPAGRPGKGALPGRRTAWVLAALVLIATAGTLVEDAGSSWAALYLSGPLHASVALAASGFIALVGAQFVGRVLGDRLVDRFGQRAVARAGGLVTAAGMGLALAFPTVPGTVLGFAAAGFGVATLVPAAMHEADELPGLKPGTGLALVSWLMRLGFLLSPPLVGLVADAFSLRAGLLVVPFAGVLVLLLAGVLQGRRSRPQH